MVDKQTIRDFHGRVIGYIETDANGDKRAYDFYRRKLGFYMKSTNTTHDFYGRVVARGDATASLIRSRDEK